MIEQLRDIGGNKDLFLHDIIGQQAADDAFDDLSPNSASSREFSKDSIEQLFPSYFEAGKSLGAIDDRSLLTTGAMCLAYAHTESVPRLLKVDALELGASALQEAAFAQAVDTHNSIEEVDTRLELISASDVMLEAAQKLLSRDSEEAHRLRLKQSFIPVHMDIVSGEVTPDTVADLLLDLATHRTNTYSIPFRRKRSGVIGEIEVLQHYWQRYTKKGQPVAIPATVRGGSGRSNPDQTHDIDVVRQKSDGSWIVLPTVEVKRAEITEDIRRRYTASLLAHVSFNDVVTIIGDHRDIVRSRK